MERSPGPRQILRTPSAMTYGEGAADSEDGGRLQTRLFDLVLVGMGVLIAVTKFDFFGQAGR